MTQKFTSDSPSIDEIMRLKQPARVTVEIPMDSAITKELSEKEAEIETLTAQLEREQRRQKTEVGKSLSEGSKVSDLTKQITNLEEELEALWESAGDVLASFTFQDIGRKKYDDLVTEHPPTAEQKKEWEEEGGEGKLAYNTDTFPPALMAATAVSPEMTFDEANKIYEEWGNFEVIALFNAAQSACLGNVKAPKSRRSLIDTAATLSSA